MSFRRPSLANLFNDRLQPHGHLQTLEFRHGPVSPDSRGEEPTYLLLAQNGANSHPPGRQDAQATPSREEVLHYLGKLADDYHLPRKLVYAVADADSSVNPGIPPRPNFKMRHGHKVYDKNGEQIVDSWDYGMMQLNDKSRIGERVRAPHGNHFYIGEDVKHDWKANARGAAAILAQEYEVAGMEQGAGATPEDRAQQTYSGYTHSHRRRDWYLETKRDGLPENAKDRNFLLKYRAWPDK